MKDIKKLREETGAGVMDAKKALEESKGDMKKAKDWIVKKGMVRAEKKSAERDAGEGLVHAYVHHDGRSGALIELACETDFVARTDDFAGLAREIAMQITSTAPKTVKSLLTEAYIRDPKKTVDEVIKAASGKLGEKIEVKRFERFRVGEK